MLRFVIIHLAVQVVETAECVVGSYAAAPAALQLLAAIVAHVAVPE